MNFAALLGLISTTCGRTLFLSLAGHASRSQLIGAPTGGTLWEPWCDHGLTQLGMVSGWTDVDGPVSLAGWLRLRITEASWDNPKLCATNMTKGRWRTEFVFWTCSLFVFLPKSHEDNRRGNQVIQLTVQKPRVVLKQRLRGITAIPWVAFFTLWSFLYTQLVRKSV